jgi:hypothetical protein
MVGRRHWLDHAAMNRTSSISRAVGRDLAYLLLVLAIGVVDCVAWVTGVSITATLLLTIVGIPVWLTTVAVFRHEAEFSRRAAGWFRRSPIPTIYPPRPPDVGRLARARTVTSDPQTWRNLGWLVLNSTAGVALATAAITCTGLAVGYILTPTYYWAIHHAAEQVATLNFGVYTVRSLGWAFVTTGLGVALLPLALGLNHVAAVGHARLAARVLGPVGRLDPTCLGDPA